MQSRQIVAHFLSLHRYTQLCISSNNFPACLRNTFKLLVQVGEDREFQRERERETLTWQRAVGNRAASSLSALIRGRRGHKGMPCRETPMSRRWEAVKGCSNLSHPAGAFSALNANNAIIAVARWQLRASSDIIHVSVGFGVGPKRGEGGRRRINSSSRGGSLIVKRISIDLIRDRWPSIRYQSNWMRWDYRWILDY